MKPLRIILKPGQKVHVSLLMPDGRWATAIPRCLVGHRELGEVSHEYWVHDKD